MLTLNPLWNLTASFHFWRAAQPAGPVWLFSAIPIDSSTLSRGKNQRDNHSKICNRDCLHGPRRCCSSTVTIHPKDVVWCCFSARLVSHEVSEKNYLWICFVLIEIGKPQPAALESSALQLVLPWEVWSIRIGYWLLTWKTWENLL